MAEQENTMVLASGKQFTVRSDGAGNWITTDAISDNDLTLDALSRVVIDDQVYINLVNDGVMPCSQGTMFHLREMTELEKMQLEYESKIDYIAAMTGVDLDV